MAAGFNRDPMFQQQQDFIAKLSLRLGVRHRDASTARLQKKRGGHAGLAKTDNQHAFVVEIHQDSIGNWVIVIWNLKTPTR